MTAKAYTLEHHSEEFQCHVCGFPVDVGDSAVMVDCNERLATFPVCSFACNRSDLKEWKRDMLDEYCDEGAHYL